MLIPMAGPFQGKPKIFSSLPSFSSLVFCVFLGLLLGWPTLGLGAEIPTETAASTPILQTPLDFDEVVKLALRQSPFFTKSSLEIEVKQLDEADSRSDFFPSIFIASRYYPSQPDTGVSDPLDYSVAFTTGRYNPLVAHLSLKAKKLITKIATLAHIKVISTGLKRIGTAFLELNASQQIAELQGTVVELAQENLRYARQRQKLGEITPMEVQIASQELVVAEAEQKAMVASQAQIREGIRNFLGLEPGQPLRLDLHQTRRQVLGSFDPAQASLAKAQARDFDVRIKKLAQELQGWNVTLAKMKFMPDFTLALQTPDPVSSNLNRGTYFSLGLSFPIFEGFKRVRDIKRQKTILKQFASEEDVKTTELTQGWRKAEEELRSASTALELAEARAELAELKERQAETLYRTGEQLFPVFLTARQARIKAKKEAATAALKYNLAVLELRYLSGDLVYNYVHEDRFR